MPRCPQWSRSPRRTLRALVVGAALFGAVPVLPAAASPAPGDAAPDELLVGLRGGVTAEDAHALYQRHGASRIQRLAAANVDRIRVAPAALDAVQGALARRGEVKFVERNGRLGVSAVANDPYYGSQWHLAKIAAPQAWDVTTGRADVVVAILDTGVDGTHPDLSGKMVAGFNFYSDNTDTSDVHGHGTKVAGVAAATGNNALGVSGVSWAGRIMPVRVTDTTGYAYYATIASAITWAADHGARVVNISIDGVAGSQTIASAAQYANGKGVVVVAGAGNCGCTVSLADAPNIISVSATDSSDNLASFSSRGNYVDLAGPGVSIYTTTRGGGYASVSGTSFSGPVVAGVAALMLSANAALTPGQVDTLLKANADDKGAAGWDPSFGYGRVNAYRAVAAAVASVPPPDTTAPAVAITSPSDGSQVGGQVVVSVAASDNSTIARVELYLDGVLKGTDTGASYSFAWDTTGSTNGTHALRARAIDAAGNAADSPVESVTVENVAAVADTTAPKVAIGSVRLQKTKAMVSVSATDASGVARMELYLDTARVGACTPSGSTCSFNVSTTSLPRGSHTLQAKAYDPAGNVGTSAPVAFVK